MGRKQILDLNQRLKTIFIEHFTEVFQAQSVIKFCKANESLWFQKNEIFRNTLLC